MAVEAEERLLFLNSADRVLAVDTAGEVVRDTGVIPGLNPGGGTFGPDGRFYAGLRSARTILTLPPDLKSGGEHALPAGIVPFPRGFGFNAEDRLFLASGIGPDGEGDDAIVAFAPGDRTRPDRLVAHDPDLSPLDLIVAPNGNVVVSPASVRLARPMPLRPSGNMLPKAGSSSAFSPPRVLRRSASHAGCASVPMAIFTAWLRTRWSHSISRAAVASVLSCHFPGFMARLSSSFPSCRGGHRCE